MVLLKVRDGLGEVSASKDLRVVLPFSDAERIFVSRVGPAI